MKQISAALLIITFIISGLAITSNVQAATDVPGQVITTDTTWTLTGSPYTLTGPVTINEGVKLTIEPGVTVNIGAFTLQINGTLEAKGTSSSSIFFSSESTGSKITFEPTSLDWNETASTGCIIENAEINASIAINDASPKISADKINDNTADSTDTNTIISVNNGSAIISNNQINGAVEVKGGSPKISANKISGGMNLYQGSPEIAGNDISGGIGEDVISITHESAPTITGNNITGKSVGVAFNMHNNGYANNAYTAVIKENSIMNCPTGIGIGEGQGTILLSGNLIFGSTTGIKVGNTSATVGIELNLIMNNTYGIDVGAKIEVFQRNTIYNNTIGIYYQTTVASAINNNNILNNTEYNLKLTSLSPTVLDATYNYWGTQDIPTINQTIYESLDNDTLGQVVFLPALSYPSADSPAVPGVDITPTPTPTPTTTPPIYTPTPTPYHTPPHTATPTATPPIEGGSLTVVEIAVIAAVIIIVLIAVVLLLKRNGKNRQSPASPISTQY